MTKAGILCVQYNPILGDKSGNLEKAEEIINQYGDDNKLDLVVLPEFFSTGICDKSFINDPEDENGGDTIKVVQGIAKRFNTNIIAGTVIRLVDGKRYNTSFAINRNGETIAKYDKIHLYNFAGGNEDKFITAGKEVVVADFDFAKVGMSICFDIKFPMHYRKLIQQGAEIIASPSGWCTLSAFSEKVKSDFVKTWQGMNMCRATETLTYFVTANQVGLADKELCCVGNSMITDPIGAIVAGADTYESGVYGEIDLGIVRDFKKLYPVAEME
ncbi:carbon-nitrogen hydrolase family protein [bacterium]|nr:carbon-nitrogen hydrolase family protein [bacterium]